MSDTLLGKTIFVTGATGLLGRSVSKVLLQEGACVRAMARKPQRAQSLARLGAEVVQADMTDLSSLEKAISGCQAVFHFAWVLPHEFVSKEYFYKVNVEGTRQLAEAALDAGVELFLHTSTAWVYGYDAGPETNERSPYLISKDNYIDTKIEAEQLLQQMRLECKLPLVIVQPSEVYGPEDEHWTLTPFHYIKTGKMVFFNGGSGLIHPIYVDDVVAGILAATRRGKIGEAYLLCGPEVVTLKRYYGEYVSMLGSRWIPSLPRWLGMILAASSEGLSAITHKPPILMRSDVRCTTMHASYDTTKAREELGFIPQVTLQVGMRRVAEWLATTEL